VMVGTIGPIGSGLPQFGFPRRFAMKHAFPTKGGNKLFRYRYVFDSPARIGMQRKRARPI
jgi:hypothetical protein